MPFINLVPPPKVPFPVYLTSSDTHSPQLSSIGQDHDGPPLKSSSREHRGDDSFLSGFESHLRCVSCQSDLALNAQIVSKGFTGRYGRAFLVAPTQSAISSNPVALRTAKSKNDALANLPNTFTHKPVPRQLVTGAHTVSDIGCYNCGNILGWKYLATDEESQHYKIGKFVLENKHVFRIPTWDVGRNANIIDNPFDSRSRIKSQSSSDIEFDSQDEDECEDLFMGVWTPQLAARRRQSRTTA